jgi:1-deoxy-D-xylulose-5-phosphate reductoisomerase
VKRISIWGATGSIGTQTLDVIGRNRDRFQIRMLTAHRNAELLFEQAKTFRPERVVITGRVDRPHWEKAFRRLGIPVHWSMRALLELAEEGKEDIAVNALVGSAGLMASVNGLKAGTELALANKEVLVMAGELVMNLAKRHGVRILPIDSEHSAVFQSLAGEDVKNINRIILTASGGPFRMKALDQLSDVTVEEALNHPNWNMGKKVSIDSATLMNKGLEVIEARWLFGVPASQIEVVIHPQSIVHSMVEFVDGSIKAQLGLPDMRIPISYALSCPGRMQGDYRWMRFEEGVKLDFEPPDYERFRSLRLAFEALEAGGAAPAVLNAADEVAVGLFLERKIAFMQIPELVETALSEHPPVKSPDIETILEMDQWTRQFIMNMIKQ